MPVSWGQPCPKCGKAIVSFQLYYFHVQDCDGSPPSEEDRWVAPPTHPIHDESELEQRLIKAFTKLAMVEVLKRGIEGSAPPLGLAPGGVLSVGSVDELSRAFRLCAAFGLPIVETIERLVLEAAEQADPREWREVYEDMRGSFYEWLKDPERIAARDRVRAGG